MTNRTHRDRITSLVLTVYGTGGNYYWRLIVSLLALPANAMNALSKRRIETFTHAAGKYSQRTKSLLSELKTFDQLEEPRKKELLAARAALLVELSEFASKVRSYRSPGAALLMPTFMYVLTHLTRRERKVKSLKMIIERIDSATFYCDLLLWAVTPSSYSEELLGDLNEEYLLRRSTDGERVAKTWYRDQVTRTLKDCLWKRIERMAAVGTLIDLLDRWFRK